MNAPAPIGFTNTGLPLTLLLAGAILLPRLYAGPATLSQARLAAAVALSAATLVLAGGVIFALVYVAGGVSLAGPFSADPTGMIGFFMGRSLGAALFWGPILVLVWFVRATGGERRKGQEIARRGRS